MRVSMREIGGTEILAGAVGGKSALAKLVATTNREPKQPEPYFLDFANIEVATVSFLRESVMAFRDHVRGRRSKYYPVIANANETVEDELNELVRARGDVLASCKLDQSGDVTELVHIGELEPKQQLTFDLVQNIGETDAGELMRSHGQNEGVTHATAWNNRLAALVARGLLVEVSQGRTKRYRPLLGGI